MEVKLTDRCNGSFRIVSLGWARIQIEKMYAAPDKLVENLKAGIPLVTQHWIYEIVKPV